MGVALQVQAEMADVARAVDRLRLGAQHEAGDHVAQLVVGQPLQQPGEVAGLALASALHGTPSRSRNCASASSRAGSGLSWTR